MLQSGAKLNLRDLFKISLLHYLLRGIVLVSFVISLLYRPNHPHILILGSWPSVSPRKTESALGLHAHLAYVVHVQLAQMLNEGGGSRPYTLPAIFLKMPYSPPIPVPAFVPESEAALPLIMRKVR